MRKHATGMRVAARGVQNPLNHSIQSLKGLIMGFIIWLVIGGLVGWIASLIMKTDREQGLLLNIVVGIVGAVIGGWVLSPLLGVSTINQSNFSIASIVVSILGAVILLGLINLLRRSRAR